LGKLEPLDLSEPVDEVVRLLGAAAPPGICVVKRYSADRAQVMADATLINLLMMNLCTNALQAMHATGGTLTVTLEKRIVPDQGSAGTAAGICMELRVQDTGHGMDAATMQRIFEPFFTTRAPGEGTGLGLAVVHGIAASLGAILLVDSDPGAGTDFKVLFPVAASQIKL
jgi:signal transduction histidine kinase